MPYADVMKDIRLYGEIPHAEYRDALNNTLGSFKTDGKPYYYEIQNDTVIINSYKIPFSKWNKWVEGEVIVIKPEEGQDMSNLPAVQDTKDPFAIMDRMDDEIIQAELENRVVNTWVYSFNVDGKLQTGLSKKGVDEACTEMAKQGHLIEEEALDWEKCPLSDEYVVFKAKVRRVLINKDGTHVPMEPRFGTKRQWIKDYRKNGNPVDDKFWFEKGSAKALRNASSRLIPAEIQAKIIALATAKGKVKNIGDVSQSPTQQQAPPTPPPAPKPKPQPKDDIPPSLEGFDLPPDNSVVFVPDKVTKKTGNRNGKDWVRYGVLSGDVWYNTFSTDFGDLAESACEYKSPVRIEYKETKFGRDIISIEQVTREPGEEG